MSQTHKAEIQKAFVADFRHQGTFQHKEQTLTCLDLPVSTDNEQYEDDTDDLFDFRKPTEKTRPFNDEKSIYTKQELCSVTEAKLAKLKDQLFNFDFVNGKETDRELARLENNLAHLKSKGWDKPEKGHATAGAIASTVYAITLYSLIVLGITAGLIIDHLASQANTPNTTTVQQVADAVRLDKAAKEVFKSTVEFSQEHNTLAVQQLSRMGQVVLSLTEPSKTAKTDDTNLDTLIGNANNTTNNNGDEK